MPRPPPGSTAAAWPWAPCSAGRASRSRRTGSAEGLEHARSPEGALERGRPERGEAERGERARPARVAKEREDQLRRGALPEAGQQGVRPPLAAEERRHAGGRHLRE